MVKWLLIFLIVAIDIVLLVIGILILALFLSFALGSMAFEDTKLLKFLKNKLKTTTNKTDGQLKELIIINNGRHEGYRTAAKETESADLKILFTNYSMQSEYFSHELQNLLPGRKYAPTPEETENPGKLYGILVNTKALLQNQDHRGVLSSCQFEEGETEKTYNAILEDHEEMDYNSFEIIKNQRFHLQGAHNKIRSLCELA